MNRVEIKRKQIQAFLCIVGASTWLLFGKLIGSEGIAYFGAAIELFTMIVLLTSAAVPDALGRLLWGKSTRLQYKNEKVIRRSVMILQLMVGLIGMVLLFLFAEEAAEILLHMPHSKLAIRILAPAILLRAITAVLLGYFQGIGNMLPSIAVTALRQVLFLGFGCLFVNLLKEYGEKVQLLLLSREIPAMYGASGLAIAVTMTELLVLIFTAVVYLISRKKPQEEGMKRTESFTSSVGGFLRNVIPGALQGSLLILPALIGCVVYCGGEEASVTAFGGFLGSYLVLCTIPVLFISASSHGLVARAVSALRKEEKKYARELFGTLIHYHVITGLFAAVYLMTLARPVAHSLSAEEESALLVLTMLQKGSSVVLFAVFSLLFLRILNFLGRNLQVLVLTGVYAVIFTVAELVALKGFNSGISGLLTAGMIALAVLCISSGVLTFRLLRLKADLLYWFGIPCIATLVCGIIWVLLNQFATPYMGFVQTMLLGLAAGLLVYWLLLLLLRSFTKLELEVMPGGRILKGIRNILPFA